MSKNPKEVFVGNLSFFCCDEDLVSLFSPYASVISAHVALNHNRKKSLMYGFVRFAHAHEAVEIARIFHGQMFMGRELRVVHTPLTVDSSLSPPLSPRDFPCHPCPFAPSGRNDIAVHLSFIAPKTNTQKPTELVLRKAFLSFGCIRDIIVREYTFNRSIDHFQGFGFIVFLDEKSAFALAASPSSFYVQGFLISASLSRS